MIDRFGRTITYLRVSLTDKCDLRCYYCMPSGTESFLPEQQHLTAAELIRVCTLAAQLGITDIRLTGGEPLLREDWAYIARSISTIPGVRRLAMTTNGLRLRTCAPLLQACGVSAVNVSLDSLCAQRYARITGFDRLSAVLDGIDAALEAGLLVKLNCVCLPDAAHDVVPLVQFAKEHPVAVRFIELMPIGQGNGQRRADFHAMRRTVYQHFGAFAPCQSRSSGPAVEETRPDFAGRIGWIAACSAPFCMSCNRIRLTSDGQIRPCLGHDGSINLRALLRSGAGDDVVRRVMQQTIYDKPISGGFDTPDACMNMNIIGG